ncbi:GNAT family N-acetyltransferase [Flavobacterium sp. HSC-61S13]|uniref:GNAT family N-acetyltransferase n=1 Tax=Flavobacterium sp. HSC-61S13 TaxID=2910963 RepID=UPI003531CCCF|nr:RimJ/RimL family protein N-acetyltransferase [Flavobacterium sp. HSC-61S13]
MEPITIKQVALNDLAQLQQIGQQTFFETFSTGNTDQNMKDYLAESFALTKLTKELQNTNSQFYFALAKDRVVGYLKLNTGSSQTEQQTDDALEIERIYVTKEFHGKKVGQILYDKALEEAQRQQASFIWLGVWEGNARAIQFYKKNGFVEFGQHLFKLGEDEQTDILMKKELSHTTALFDIQPVLENDQVLLLPLKKEDFEELYLTASDPKIWEQHPNTDRWKKEVFENFFEGALKSHGAFKIVDKLTGKVIGSTRFYDYKHLDNSILIGYTFYAVSHWGKGINTLVKKTMLNYAFQFVDQVYFHIGANNIRSQIAISRLGAEKIAEEVMPYYGEAPRLNFVYSISKNAWKELF